MLKTIMFYLFVGHKIIVVISEFDSIFIKIMLVLDTRVLAIKGGKVYSILAV